MEPGGIIITITPNRLLGPCDVTQKFEPRGSAAKGFHLHEYTFSEILSLFRRYNIKSAFSVFIGLTWDLKKKYSVLPATSLDRLKCCIEYVHGSSPWPVKRLLIALFACTVSITKVDK
jgi:hypothetical protein